MMDQYSAYFFRSSMFMRLDATGGSESWHGLLRTFQEFPDLAYMWRTFDLIEHVPNRAVQVTDTVVRIEDRYLDVRRGGLVPPPPRSRWSEPGVGVDGWLWKIGSAIGPGPVVLTFTPDGEQAWMVHVPTGAWSGPFDPKPSDLGDPLELDTFLVLPGLADPNARTIYVLKGPAEDGGDGQAWIYDLATGDNLDVQAATNRFPGLATFGGVVDCACVVYGSFDVPGRARYTRELSDSFFDELSAIASTFGLSPHDLALVLEAISGLNPAAYHPAGRFGLLQFSADELAAMGLQQPEQLFSFTAVEQLDVVRARLQQLGISGAASAGHLWAAFLIPGFDAMGAPMSLVIAASQGPDPAIYERLAVLDSLNLGFVRLNALTLHLQQIAGGERWNELSQRLLGQPVNPLAPDIDTVEFVDWLSVDTAGTATGTLLFADVTLTGGVIGRFSVLDGSSNAFDTDAYTPRRANSDLVYIEGLPSAPRFTLTFSSPIRDPMLQLASFGSVMTFDPGTELTLISGDDTLKVDGNTVTGAVFGSADSNGTFRVSGLFMTLGFTVAYVGPGAGPDGVYMQIGGSAPPP
jgi:hypothetical protein